MGRVILPSSLRNQLLKELHYSHFGIVRMKSLARQFIWWPNIDNDIELIGKGCTKCSETSPNPPSAPLHPWQFPERPWQRIHVDLAGPFLNKMWLVIMDAHSKWPEVFCLNQNSTSASVIHRVRETITRFGIPIQLVSDNGPQFVSAEFKSFCASNGIRHSTSSAYHPRSNGEAERFVKTFKKSMQHATGDKELALQKFLFTYRITPHSTTGSAPSELLQGRKLRSLLDLVRPNVEEKVSVSQQQQRKDFDKRTRDRHFTAKQKVWVQTFSKNEPKWTLGTIVKAVGPVSYQISVINKTIKRHVDHIMDASVVQQPEEEREMEIPPAFVHFPVIPQAQQQSAQSSPARSSPRTSPSSGSNTSSSSQSTPSPSHSSSSSSSRHEPDSDYEPPATPSDSSSPEVTAPSQRLKLRPRAGRHN